MLLSACVHVDILKEERGMCYTFILSHLIFANDTYFQSLGVVGRGSKTQLQVTGNCNCIV